MTKIIGITGGIAMGKSTVAKQFAQFGANVSNADDIVHALLAKGGEAVEEVKQYFPSTIIDGAVDRRKLGEIVFADVDKRKKLESILHPMVAFQELSFIEEETNKGAKMAILDIPLLFETGADTRCDVTVTVSAPLWIQRRRAMKRPHMTKEKLEHIIAMQMSDAEKRKRADFIVQTGFGKAYSFWQVNQIVRKLNVT
ncbi:MAG: dephospho-CoA kinase [Rickettsiales bacterium]